MVLGAGPGGYTAAFRAADLGKKVVLIERYASARRRLPQRRLHPVQGAAACRPRHHGSRRRCRISACSSASRRSISPSCAPGRRAWSARLTKGLAGLAKQRKVQVVRGVAKFTGPHMVEVETAEGKKTVSFDHCIIAAGSQVARIPGFPYDDPRLIDSTGALELEDIPKRMLVIGGGIIGLEMATVYDALGAKITRGRAAGRADSGRRPRHRPAAAQAHREALRSDPAEDQGHQNRGAARRA